MVDMDITHTNGRQHTLSPELHALQQKLRLQFPFIIDNEANGQSFFENAGGSAVPQSVIDAVASYYRRDYVQLGSGYDAANRADKVVGDAHKFVNMWMNNTGSGETILSDSTSRLFQMISDCYTELMVDGDEIIIAENAHEAGAGPWARLAGRTGSKLITWRCDSNGCMSIDDLAKLVNKHTRIVALPHCSNIAGSIIDVRSVCELVHKQSDNYGVVCVDSVAYAPHRMIDVEAWGVDFYCFSLYKTYGPHMAALYGKQKHLDTLMQCKYAPINHFFIPNTAPYKLELGCLSHEGCAAITGLKPYFNLVTGQPADAPMTRHTIVQTFEVFCEMELPITQMLIQYLTSKSSVRLIGSAKTDSASRCPTISFVSSKCEPNDIVKVLHKAGVMCRTGHCYAVRLVDALGIGREQGVVRISAVHYNTVEEVNRIITILDTVL